MPSRIFQSIKPNKKPNIKIARLIRFLSIGADLKVDFFIAPPHLFKKYLIILNNYQIFSKFFE